MSESKEKTIKPRRGVRLKTIADVRRLLAKTANQLLRGEIDAATARAIGYLGDILVRVLEKNESSQEQQERTHVVFVGIDPSKM